MALLNLLRLLSILAVTVALPVRAQNSDFVSLCYHEVENDQTRELSRSAVHASDLAAQFAWLKAHDYHPVSLQQIIDARNGGTPLPNGAVLLTFDDGRKDVYTRVFPLLKLFHYPALIALVGRWMETPDGSMVDYDGHSEPRENFVNWDEVRRMQASGLIEVASHSYDLHRGVPANRQDNIEPAAITRIYADGHYETDQHYLARLQADMAANRDLIRKEIGYAPRALVWPYGRSNLAAQRLASDMGMPITLTLIDGINHADTPLSQIKRHIIESSPSLQSFAEALRQTWNPDPARSVGIQPQQWSDTETDLSQTLDRLQRLSANIGFIDPRFDRSRAEAILFPSARKPLHDDQLNRIAWQIERRTGTAALIDIPASWLDDAQLLADLARHVNFAGVRLPLAPDDPRAAVAIATLSEWRWPLRVAYAPNDFDTMSNPWPHLQADDLLIVPAEILATWQPPRAHAAQLLIEFQADSPDTVAAQMRKLEAAGYRQFGIAAFPASEPAALWRALSLRSQPLLP